MASGAGGGYALLSILLGPFAAGMVALIFANVGLAAKSKQIAYYLARAQLLEKILANVGEPTTQPQQELRAASQRDLFDIMSYLRATSIAAKEQAQLDFDRQRWSRRLLPPTSATVGGIVGVIVYYLYVAMAVSYAAMGVVLAVYPVPHVHGWYAFVVVPSHITAAALGYWWAVRSARSSAMLSRARRLLALYETAGAGSAELRH